MRSALLVVLWCACACALAACARDAYCVANCLEGGVSGDAAADGLVGDGPMPDHAPMDMGLECTDTGVETCNMLDDDCDGVVDNGFDVTSDVRNCGMCGHPCIFPNADAECTASVCVQTGCLEGFVDLNGTSDDGCEYRCPVFPGVAEVCNGIDDDCNGVIDDGALPPPPTDLCRTTAGTPCAGVVATCQTRGAVTTYFCDYPSSVEFDPSVPNGIVLAEARCDGLDGDCDGAADDGFVNLGTACDDGGLGACRGTGAYACTTDHAGTECVITSPGLPAPGTETCNGVDDDCNGTVDDHVVDDMVHVTASGADVWVYRYEAARVDATGATAGTDDARACSAASRVPWTSISEEGAAAACAAAGKRLCTATEWQAACQGAAGGLYPYGASYAADACNGADHDGAAGGGVDHVVMPGGSLATCASPDGLQDLSGNVKEWTDDPRGSVGGSAIYVVRGGSAESPELGLTCATDLSRATHDTLLPMLGFRCCADAPDVP